MNTFWLSMLGGEIDHIDVNGIRTRVLEAGDPASDHTILCVHGSGGHAENFTTNLVAFGATGHALAPDLLGHGLNARPEGTAYTMRGVLDHLKGVLDHHGATNVSVVGLSLGGALAIHLARECPDIVRKVVMVCPANLAPGPRDVEKLRASAARMRDGSVKAIQDPTLEKCRARLEPLLSDTSKLTDEMVQLRQYMYSLPGAESMGAVLDDNVKEIDRYAVGDEVLADVKAEVLLVAGGHDRTPATVTQEVCSRLAHGELAVFQNSGHWPHVEEQDRFNERVVAFLRG